MPIHFLILLAGFGIFLVSSLYQIFQIIQSKTENDFAQPKGKVALAVVYSFTKAMSPFKKESAYLHFPTYTAGIIFHIGTFLSFVLLVLHFFSITIASWLEYCTIILLSISSICGISIFLKRIFGKKHRKLSHPDDFFSNLLVTGFQLLSISTIVWEVLLPYLFIYSSLLFIYIPISKLSHFIYFFTSRIFLGIFYGRRGLWVFKRQ